MTFIQTIKQFVLENKKAIRYHITWWWVFYTIDYFFAFFTNDILSPLRYIENVFFVTIWFYIATYAIFLPSLPHFFRTVLKLILFLSIFIMLKLGFDVAIGFVQEGKYKTSFFYELWRFSTMSFYAFAYWIYLQSLKEQKLRRETEAKLLKSEIGFLKAQINPHFLFNTLNFVYNDVSNVSTRSGEAIMSLTKMMRYSVESTTTDKSSLSKETEGIEEYLKLQRLRFGDNLMLSYVKSGNFMLYAFPPLVLLSIIENAFKYGVIDDAQNPIDINLSVNQDRLSFRCQNKKRMDFIDKETTAVGLANIEKRLEIAYNTHFDLRIHDDTEIYEVLLTVNWIKE